MVVGQQTSREALDGCRIIWHDDDNIDLQCESEEQARYAREYVNTRVALGWIAENDERYVHMQKPHPMPDEKVVEALTHYHGLDEEREHIRRILTESFGRVTLPTDIAIGEAYEGDMRYLRQLAGFNRPGYRPEVANENLDRIFEIMEEKLVTRRNFE